MKKTRIWIVITALLLAVSGGMTFVLFNQRAAGSIANVYVDGQCVYSVDLSLVTAPFTKEIAFDEGRGSTVSVESGRICISAADCPDQVCVRTGWISDSAAPIVCLPHRLLVRIEENAAGGDQGFDSVVR